MFDDILKAAREQVTERLNSPIIGSFVVSWCLWNYKFLVILFSSATVQQTFSLIDSLIFPNTLSILGRGFLFPGLTAAAYIFLYPYPSNYAYGFTRRRQREQNKLRQQIENETLLTVEESRRIRDDIVRAERKHREELDRLNEELTRFKSTINSGDVFHKSDGPLSESVPLLEKTQIELLLAIEKVGGKATEASIIESSSQSKVRTEFDLGELQRLKLLHKDYDQRDKGYKYEFTHEGRRTVVKFGVG
jgi:hypothetical protein